MEWDAWVWVDIWLVGDGVCCLGVFLGLHVSPAFRRVPRGKKDTKSAAAASSVTFSAFRAASCSWARRRARRAMNKTPQRRLTRPRNRFAYSNT
ncbi:hypothetical protein E2C01_071396 [Portunus trituberculatus]|uniref:Uncharacterized protein n=1 Tax=Portunus trituberculatus TaxID=210409 RepID=A0A5B7I500_PORTR|nr:hypothetical protein [Portunus trituberculatus]